MTAPTFLRGQAAPLLSLLLLGGIVADRWLFAVPSGDPRAYHESVRVVAARIPLRVGEWVGREIEPPEAAVSLLRPNAIRGVRFEHEATKEEVSLTLVQCRDARDMGGHWPPVCYPAHGWTLRGTQKTTIAL